MSISKSVYKITHFTVIILIGLVALILLFDNVTSAYSLYFRVLNLIIFCLFIGFGLWLFEVQRNMFKLYENSENKSSLDKLSMLFSLFNMSANLFLLMLAYGIISRLYNGKALLG